MLMQADDDDPPSSTTNGLAQITIKCLLNKSDYTINLQLMKKKTDCNIDPRCNNSTTVALNIKKY